MTIGYKIKKIRELKNFTQEYVADKVGMSVAGYGKLERDEADIPFSRLQQIANVFNLKVEDVTSFDEKYVFYNYATANQGQNVIYQNMNDNEKKLYEDKTKLLEDKITYLEEKIKFLEGK
jgi:transcriptional regulator with XRE-family HTH domain